MNRSQIHICDPGKHPTANRTPDHRTIVRGKTGTHSG